MRVRYDHCALRSGPSKQDLFWFYLQALCYTVKWGIDRATGFTGEWTAFRDNERQRLQKEMVTLRERTREGCRPRL